MSWHLISPFFSNTGRKYCKNKRSQEWYAHKYAKCYWKTVKIHALVYANKFKDKNGGNWKIYQKINKIVPQHRFVAYLSICHMIYHIVAPVCKRQVQIQVDFVCLEERYFILVCTNTRVAARFCLKPSSIFGTSSWMNFFFKINYEFATIKTEIFAIRTDIAWFDMISQYFSVVCFKMTAGIWKNTLDWNLKFADGVLNLLKRQLSFCLGIMVNFLERNVTLKAIFGIW